MRGDLYSIVFIVVPGEVGEWVWTRPVLTVTSCPS